MSRDSPLYLYMCVYVCIYIVGFQLECDKITLSKSITVPKYWLHWNSMLLLQFCLKDILVSLERRLFINCL